MKEELKEAFDQYVKESYFGKVLNRLDLHEVTFEAGYNSALDKLSASGSFEKIPCTCRFHEQQVCDFCQGVVVAFRKTMKGEEAK